jgi:hypothetical protein
LALIDGARQKKHDVVEKNLLLPAFDFVRQSACAISCVQVLPMLSGQDAGLCIGPPLRPVVEPDPRVPTTPVGAVTLGHTIFKR